MALFVGAGLAAVLVLGVVGSLWYWATLLLVALVSGKFVQHMMRR
ncbi:MAG: hypothetical protein ACOC93_06245 [Planctomycetota bacterium]